MLRWKGVSADLDPRPGGVYRVDMNGRDVAKGEYLEVVPHSRVVFTWGWEGEESAVPPGSTTVEITPLPRTATGPSCGCATSICRRTSGNHTARGGPTTSSASSLQQAEVIQVPTPGFSSEECSRRVATPRPARRVERSYSQSRQVLGRKPKEESHA